MIKIWLSSVCLVFAYAKGIVNKAHLNEIDERKVLPSVLFKRTLVHTRVKGTDDKVRFIYYTTLVTM